MAAVFRNSHFQLKLLCDALGITDHHVTHLVIEADIKALTVITATMLMTLDQSDKVCEVVKRYELHEISPKYDDCHTINEANEENPPVEPIQFREWT